MRADRIFIASNSSPAIRIRAGPGSASSLSSPASHASKRAAAPAVHARSPARRRRTRTTTGVGSARGAGSDIGSGGRRAARLTRKRCVQPDPPGPRQDSSTSASVRVGGPERERRTHPPERRTRDLGCGARQHDDELVAAEPVETVHRPELRAHHLLEGQRHAVAV
ncbi:MAG: hypothetical protein O9345_06735 [Burkholderiaceae bacterium]|nr:hypothetical protein [Burkholderiaceae bacterium]